MWFLGDAAIAALVGIVLMPFIHAAYVAWVRRRHPPSGQRFAHAGAQIHYTRTGSGPAVVLVHGANGTSGDFPPELIADLARDHTVIAVDRPGHGWSGAPRGPLGLEPNAAAVLALVRELGVAPATLVGHSYGAAVVLRAALDAPECVRDVVAVCPCTALDERNARYGSLPFMSGPVGGALLQFFALPMIPFGMTLRTDAWYPAPAPRGWGASRVFAYIPSQMHTAVRNFSELQADVAWLQAHVADLRVPLTVVAGAQDLVTPPARHVDWLRRALPAARIQIVPHVGHWLPRLMPEFVAAAVRGRPSLTPARNPQSEASPSR
ncbi:MAG TPA: alpha/beta hydrolase [Methylomirabilota bacterium]|nr:alpha/beta hydrolase [Methylomirabilota bacterium]